VAFSTRAPQLRDPAYRIYLRLLRYTRICAVAAAARPLLPVRVLRVCRGTHSALAFDAPPRLFSLPYDRYFTLDGACAAAGWT